MWVPKGLYIKNFRSIEDELFPFVGGKTYLLQGVNLTDEGVASNGSGKSSFREALAYVLGLPVFSATINDLIRDNSGEMSVTFFAKESTTQKTLEITRSVSRKGTKLQILLGEVDQVNNFSTIPEGDKLIIDLLGVPKEDLLNHFIISKEKFTSFFTSSDNDKKELINRFSGANKIDGVDSLIQEDIKKLEVNKRKLEDELIRTDSRIDVLTEDLNKEIDFDHEGLKSSILTALNLKLGEYESELEALIDRVEKGEQYIIDTKAEAKKLEPVLIVKQKEVTEIGEKVVTLEKQRAGVREELIEYKGFVTEIKVSLKGVISCPECSYEFNPGEKIDVKEARATLPLIEKTIERLQLSFDSLGDEIVKLNKEELVEAKNSEKLIADKYNTLLNSVEAGERKVKQLISEAEFKSESINKIEKEIENEKKAVHKSREQEIRDKIKESEKQKFEIGESIKSVSGQIEELTRWVIRFKKFKSHLANQSLGNIQGFANLYLEKMRSNLGVIIEGFKQNKDGSVREKITPVIMRNGVIEGSGSYKKYSGGERCRIDVAVTLAMRHLINQASPTGGLDLFWVDEITEGLDSVGVENIAESINSLGVTSLMVSHVNHEKTYPNIFTAIKEKGVTRIAADYE